MARKSIIAREAKRRKVVEKYAELRKELKEKVITKGCKSYLKMLHLYD